MARPGRLKEIEKMYGRPVLDVIVDALNEYQSVRAASQVLFLSEQTIFKEIDGRVEKQCQWVKRPNVIDVEKK